MPIRKSMGSIGSLSGSYLQSLLGSVVQGPGVAAPNTQGSAGAVSSALPPDTQQLSGLAQVVGKLRQLQKTDPAQFRQVTQQIATNLQAAAQTAQAGGNTTTANQLNQLSANFADASKSGQLPDIQGLTQAKTGGHHHHGHAHAAPPATGTDSGSTDASASSLLLDQLAAASRTDGTQPDALNPTAIILDTLSRSGLTA